VQLSLIWAPSPLFGRNCLSSVAPGTQERFSIVGLVWSNVCHKEHNTEGLGRCDDLRSVEQSSCILLRQTDATADDLDVLMTSKKCACVSNSHEWFDQEHAKCAVNERLQHRRRLSPVAIV
jgi:hypothetical protein